MLTRQFKLTGDDLDFSTGNLILLAPEESLVQRVSTRLQTFLGEIFTNESLGVPYFQQIFADKNPRVSVLNAGFSGPVLALDGVSKIERLEFTLQDNRRLDVQIGVLGEDGTAILETFNFGV
jgi:hypothetical protein